MRFWFDFVLILDYLIWSGINIQRQSKYDPECEIPSSSSHGTQNVDHYYQLHNHNHHHHIIGIIIITTKSTFVRMLMTASSSDLVWIISVTVKDKFAMFSISTTALAEMLNIFVRNQAEWMKTINERWLIVSPSITLLSSYFCSFTPSYSHTSDCHPANNDTPR